MFVENCLVDEDEQLTVEKTGKEKRRERQKMRKVNTFVSLSILECLGFLICQGRS